jgi:hypothetical protein
MKKLEIIKKHMEKEIIVVGATVTLDFQTHFRIVLFQEVESGVTNNSEIFA